MRTTSVLAAIVTLVVGASAASAQTTPTGALTGKVTDPDGLVLPGVIVTVTSPSLQGSREAATSENGDYIIPFLPAGDYRVVFAFPGFATLEKATRVQIADTVPLNVQMSLAGVAETVNVTAEALVADFTNTATAAASYRQELIDKLPVSRAITGAVLLAPGTTGAGPGGNITFSGAMSYEGLFLLNGVVLNETLRNQARSLYIEDAIEEVKTSTGTISAEYGRFSGGVANTITKSGGNIFSGSFRTTLRSDKWTALTPFEKENLDADPRADALLPTYEMTFGGPIVKNRIWFFGAARFEESENANTTRYTNIPFTTVTDDKRYEGKVTWTVTPRHTFKGNYTWKKNKAENTYYSSATIMDLDSLIDREDPESLISANYTGIVRSNFFVEAQFSRRALSYIGAGSRYTDIERGTIIFDRSRSSSRYNSPTFCAVCGAKEGELNEEIRNNYNFIAKGSYYLSTQKTGAHTVVFGFDGYQDSRKNDNYQSGSGYRLYANSTIIVGSGADTRLYPVINPGATDRTSSAAYIMWNPIFNTSVGSKLRTYSGFVNDSWQVDKHLTFNVGVRWDKNVARDQGGKKVVDDAAWSPRLSATWDPRGNGAWTFNGGIARYAMGATSAMVDQGSAAGRQSTFRYVYRGPGINQNKTADSPDLVSAHDALRMVFDWFFANGGTDRPLRDSPTYAGVNRIVGENLITPSTWEYTIGTARRIGSRGSFRVDGIIRRYRDFYAERKDLTTGQVADPFGTKFDLGVVVNTNDLERTYKALQTQVQYRFTADLTAGGNYTLSQARGDFNGETSSDGPVTADLWYYPEYRERRWNYPVGDLSIDQRHKVRMWLNYGIRLGAVGRVDVGALQNITSGEPYSDDAAITIGPYVNNPGYLTPPTTATYYFGGRGNFRTATITSTDLSLNYALPVGRLGPKAEFFFRFVVDNAFNQSAVDGPNETIDTNATNADIPPFNPFTEKPVYGVHYVYGPLWGRAISAAGYQNARSFFLSGGFRF
ncbi:MAG: carboxypeptidase regulatory-like domain-containing protein [Vicinamibacterales bacterium]